MVKVHNPNAYEQEIENGVGKNSLVITSDKFVTKAVGVVDTALATEDIIGLSQTKETFASDNQTVGLATVCYNPFDDNSKYELPVAGIVITFSGALVTSNDIDLDVNGVAMTQVPFNTSDAQTLADIATQLVADFPLVIASASAGTNSVEITPVGSNDTVAITDVLVTAGAGQATATVANQVVLYTDEGKYYDVVTGSQALDYFSAHATSGQVLLYRAICDGTVAVVKVANT